MKSPRIALGPRRRGIVAVFVLVCLVVIASISGVLLRIGLAERDRIRTEQWKLQTEWLVESGLERGASRLAVDPAYTGETWNLAPDELGGAFPGRVSIVVERIDKEPARRLVRVRADYPRDATRRARASKDLAVIIAPASRSSTP
jgi:hypothetical protein